MTIREVSTIRSCSHPGPELGPLCAPCVSSPASTVPLQCFLLSVLVPGVWETSALLTWPVWASRSEAWEGHHLSPSPTRPSLPHSLPKQTALKIPFCPSPRGAQPSPAQQAIRTPGWLGSPILRPEFSENQGPTER